MLFMPIAMLTSASMLKKYSMIISRALIRSAAFSEAISMVESDDDAAAAANDALSKLKPRQNNCNRSFVDGIDCVNAVHACRLASTEDQQHPELTCRASVSLTVFSMPFSQYEGGG